MTFQRTPSGTPVGGSTPADGSVTNAKVAPGAAIDLDKTVDSATRLALTSAQSTKLAGVATGATANDTDANLKARGNHTGSQAISTVTGLQAALDAAQPLDSDLTTIAELTATTDNVVQSVGSAWASRTPAQLKATLALAKGDVGLGNVDNTADTAKPVSTATQTALDAKATVDADGHVADTVMPLRARGIALARRTGAIAETFSRRGAAVAMNAPTSQRIYFTALALLKGQTVSTVTFCSGTTALGTGVNQWACLYDGAGAKLRVSNDDTSGAWAANTEKTFTLATSYAVTADALFYVGLMINGTTPPSLMSVNDTAVAMALAPRLTGVDLAAGWTNPASAPANITWTNSAVEWYAWVA